MVKRIILTEGQGGEKVAIGVELAEGRRIHVNLEGEVLLCA